MTTRSTKPKESSPPKYLAFHVVDGKGDSQKARWNRIGVVFVSTPERICIVAQTLEDPLRRVPLLHRPQSALGGRPPASIR